MPSISLPIAVLGAGTIAGVAGLGSAALGANAQEKAAKSAEATQLQMFNQTAGYLSPYRQFGNAALGPLGNLLTGSPSQIEGELSNLPGYQFNLTQGLKATQNSAAARGLGVSGAALKGAAQYAQGLAGSTYQSQVNNLMNAAGIGENAAAGTGQAAIQTGQGIGSAQLYGGSAAASGYYGAGNALMQGFNSVPAAAYLNSMYGNGQGLGFGGGTYQTPQVDEVVGGGGVYGPGL